MPSTPEVERRSSIGAYGRVRGAWLVIAFVQFLNQSPVALAQDGPDPSPGARLLQQAMENRYEIESGVFRAHVRKTVTGGRDMPPLEALPFEVFCTFDWPAGKFRLDSNEPFYTSTNRRPAIARGQPPPGPNDPLIATEGLERLYVKVVRTPEWMIEWMGDGKDSLNEVAIRNPDVPFQYLELFHCIDPRTTGFVGPVDFQQGRTLEELQPLLAGQGIDIVEHLPDGFVRLTARFDPYPEADVDDVRIVRMLDATRGLVPVTLEVWYEHLYEDLDFDKPPQRVTVEWSENNGVWVPAHSLIEMYVPQDDGRTYHESFEYDFEWESVNEPVSNDRFAWQDFEDLPQGTPVYDKRNGRVRIATIGETDPFELPREQAPPSRNWLLPANLVLVVILLVALYLRRRRAAAVP